jgi:hypothetical protein
MLRFATTIERRTRGNSKRSVLIVQFVRAWG